jgi:WD40 repeat protein
MQSFLVIIEAATGMVVSTFVGHKSAVDCVAFSPDDSLLVSGSQDRTVNLWDVQTGGLVRSVEMTERVQSVGFSHDGTMVACNFGIWDRALEELVHSFKRGVTKLAWSPNSADVVLAYQNGDVGILDATNGTYWNMTSGHDEPVKSVAYSRDGSKVASGSSHLIKVHDADTGNVLREYPADDPPEDPFNDDHLTMCLAFSHDGDSLVIAQQMSMTIRDLETSVDSATFQPMHTTHSVSVSPDGMSIALATDDKLSIWQTDCSTSWRSNDHSITNCLAISPDSTFVASASYDCMVEIQNFASGEWIHTFGDRSDSDLIRCVVISPDSSLVASASGYGRILVWRVADRALVFTFDGYAQYTGGITFSPDGRRIASVSENSVVRLFEIEGEKMIGFSPERPSHWEGSDPSIRFSDDGTGIILLNASGEGSRSWEIVPRTVPALDADPDELPITFIPRDYPFQHHSPALYKYDDASEEASEWITDQHGRRVLWLPTDLRGYSSCCQGSQVAIGTETRRVIWFDFGLPSVD